MRVSVLLAISGAALAAATPVLGERRYPGKSNVVVVTVVVIKGATATATTTRFGNRRPVNLAVFTTDAPAALVSAPAPEKTPEPKSEPSPVAAEAPKVAEAADVTLSGDDYQGTALYHHNVHRANHSAPAVTWGQTYADFAATVAKSCRFAHDLSPGGGGDGQNIAMYAGTDAAKDNATHAGKGGIGDGWYNGEITFYPSGDYGKDNPNMSKFENWGHFSQMVWKGTKQIGCATQFCPKGSQLNKDMDGWFTVCNYFPPGNMGGGYGNNVLPPLGRPIVPGH
ncbi:CAP domain-containing protein [Podospora didyma]|uniref:CAP domain-containing protein n=1 Tax=Podospora didyma TaxID=330526 RepID=A0AAE0JXX7_9PEZI|nr:CAP domain-containing protein [Podospora didyma]